MQEIRGGIWMEFLDRCLCLCEYIQTLAKVHTTLLNVS